MRGRFYHIALMIFLLGLFCFLLPTDVQAQATSGGTRPSPVSMKIDFNTGEGADYSVAIQLLIFMTLLTLAPTIIMMMTCFTRIVIVLGFIGRAMGTQGVPSNQIITGLALFLTFFLMAPVWDNIYSEAITPYTEGQITSTEALNVASQNMKQFMLSNVNDNDVEFFLGLSGRGPTRVADLPLSVVTPAFMISELRTAFKMGFLIYIPFLVVDFLIASTLMSMGMMMMPPVIISMPFKILLFVLVDGWSLVVRSLIQSFNF